MLQFTPFHKRTGDLCQPYNWRRWAGYLVVGSYDMSHEREYYAIRNSAALIDVTPLYKYLITGPDASALLDRVVTRNVAKCAVGQVMYTPWCDHAGKVIDDGTIQRLDENIFRMTSAEPSLRWLLDNAHGLNVTLKEQTDDIAALALQGPHSRNILKEVTDVDMDALRYFRLVHTSVGGVDATITRTGYTGDLGYEIWVDARRAVKLWDVLMEAGAGYNITPTGILALDMARVEAGLLMAEVDYVSSERAVIESQKSSPLELGLGWAVDLKKDHFNGKKALVEEAKRGSEWQFVGIEVSWNSLEEVYAEVGLPPQLPATAWRTSVPLYWGGRQVGYGSSGCFSPLLKRYTVLAHIEATYSQPGTPVYMEVTAEHQRRMAEAVVVKTPFFEPDRKKA
jgi:aminomethyltransferase